MRWIALNIRDTHSVALCLYFVISGVTYTVSGGGTACDTAGEGGAIDRDSAISRTVGVGRAESTRDIGPVVIEPLATHLIGVVAGWTHRAFCADDVRRRGALDAHVIGVGACVGAIVADVCTGKARHNGCFCGKRECTACLARHRIVIIGCPIFSYLARKTGIAIGVDTVIRQFVTGVAETGSAKCASDWIPGRLLACLAGYVVARDTLDIDLLIVTTRIARRANLVAEFGFVRRFPTYYGVQSWCSPSTFSKDGSQ